MDFKTRLLPTRTTLEQTGYHYHGEAFDVQVVELALMLLNTGSLLREGIYEPLQVEHQLSEGKFIMLMALKEQPEGMLLGQLAQRIGVSFATVSVMVKRELDNEMPFIAVVRSKGDARQRFVSLTPHGEAFLEKVLPEHYQRMKVFSDRLSVSERKTLLTLLEKLHLE